MKTNTRNKMRNEVKKQRKEREKGGRRISEQEGGTERKEEGAKILEGCGKKIDGRKEKER